MSSVFTDIINGRRDGVIMYEDEHCIVLMDVFPVLSGHVLVIPRQELIRIQELTAPLRSHLFEVANAVTVALDAAGLSEQGAHIVINDGKGAGQTVPHVHLHVVPRSRRDAFPFPALLKVAVRKLLRQSTPVEQLEVVAVRLRQHFPQTLAD